MKTLIIGGTGHIGGFLIRQLVDEGAEVVVVSSGRTPLSASLISDKVRSATLSYEGMLADGSFAALLAREQPGAVVDLLQRDARGIHSACERAGVGQIVFCGSLWMYGRPKVVPTPEVAQSECPFEGYKIRYEQLLEAIALSRLDGVAVSAIMPPNICGPGKIPLDGTGGRSIEVHRAHRDGEEVCLPSPGTNLVGPCDADDVARGFVCALKNREAAAGEVFNVGSAYALTSERFIGAYAEVYGSRIPIRYVDPAVYVSEVSPDIGASFHFVEHMCPDISKISAKLGYRPKYTPEQTMERAVRWMRDLGMV